MVFHHQTVGFNTAVIYSAQLIESSREMRRPLAQMSQLVESRQAWLQGNNGRCVRLNGLVAQTRSQDSGKISLLIRSKIQKPGRQIIRQRHTTTRAAQKQNSGQTLTGGHSKRTHLNYFKQTQLAYMRWGETVRHRWNTLERTAQSGSQEARKRRICWQLRGETTVTSVLRSPQQSQVIGIS